jgi:hypothetical protein
VLLTLCPKERLAIPMGKEHLAIPPTYGRGRHPSAPMAKRERWPSLWPSPPFGLWERVAPFGPYDQRGETGSAIDPMPKGAFGHPDGHPLREGGPLRPKGAGGGPSPPPYGPERALLAMRWPKEGKPSDT